MWVNFQVSSFVAALRMFFTYGVIGGTQLKCPVTGDREKEICLRGIKSPMEEPKRTDNGPYRPPHLRRRGSLNTKQTRGWDPFSDHESSLDFSSSDSDYSDSDGSTKDNSSVKKSKVRVAAIDCIQVMHNFSLIIVLVLVTTNHFTPKFHFKFALFIIKKIEIFCSLFTLFWLAFSQQAIDWGVMHCFICSLHQIQILRR